MISITDGNKDQVEKEIQDLLNDFELKIKEILATKASEPKTCATCHQNPGPDIHADDSECVKCASHLAAAEDVEKAKGYVAEIINTYERLDGYISAVNAVSLARNALAALDRLAGKLDGTV